MAMGKAPGDGEGGEDVGFAEINITPLTDIFLVLLIIFMVTSSVIVQQAPSGGAQQGLKVNLPKGGATDVTARATDLSVAILSDGRFVLGGNVVSEDELKRTFAEAHQKDPDTVVIVQADEGVPHGTVVVVMELAKSAGLGQLAIGVRENP
ncbi:ExbD/TolR family protein [[Archangium] primigenium]|uniref:ExbD/TolR family protein n=1 Tax=Melittangium TaxID=44 RepID=UPI0019588691|nr:biopolymer transporter ExbD [Archangium primigenium]MBM7115592.1 biopolymer transporter ExbD [Archangium primigenium]